MKEKKLLLSILLSCFLLLTALGVTVSAETSITTGVQDANFDVMFVIDYSGSMYMTRQSTPPSDPNNLRRSAGTMFVELLSNDLFESMSEDDYARVGYVEFTNVIVKESGLLDLSTTSSKEAFKNELANLQPDGQNVDTDISLGVTRAYQLLKEGGAVNTSDRKPAIILLTDGHTDLRNGPRTEEESRQELEGTLAELSANKVPVYVLGLNNGNAPDIAEFQQNMQEIADKSGGKFFNIDSADEFTEKMTEIFYELSQSDLEEITTSYDPATGRFNAPFVVDKPHVLSADIVILKSKGVSDPKLHKKNEDTNQLEEIPLDAAHRINVSTDTDPNNSSYIVIRYAYPEQGEYVLSVKGNPEDKIKVKLITSYDLVFSLENTNGYTGEDITVTGKIFKEEKQLTDEDIMDGSQAFCTITDSNGMEVVSNVPMTYNATSFSYSYTTSFPQPGEYTLVATVEGKDGSYTKESDPLTINVEIQPIIVTGSLTKSMWSNPFKTTETFNIYDVVKCRDFRELDVAVESGSELISIEHTKDTGEIVITPVTTGKGDTILQVSDPFGQKEQIKLTVEIKPSWIFIAAALGVIVLIVLIILAIKSATAPRLTMPVRISMTMPPTLMDRTPQEITIVMPNNRKAASLMELISGDSMARNILTDPINMTQMTSLVSGLRFKAEKDKKVRVTLAAKIPGIIQVYGKSVDVSKKAFTKTVRENEDFAVQYALSPDGSNSATITLKFIDKNNVFGNAGTGNIFGGDDPQQGFGNRNQVKSPFGGANQGGLSGGGFGGFGGDQSQNGFGGNPFGGGQPQGGNFGGFGGGQPQGGNFGGNFGGGQPQGGNFGGNFGGGQPQGGNFGGNAPQGGNFGGNAPQGGNYGGNAPQGGNFGGNAPQGGNFGGGQQDGNFGGGNFNFGNQNSDGGSEPGGFHFN